MDTHIKIIAILHLAFGLLGLFAVLVLFTVFGGAATIVSIAAPPAEAFTAVPIISIVGSAIMFIILICSLPSVIGGIGLLRNDNWGRIIIILVSIFNLFNIPFGTILAIYSLVILLSAESNQIFSGSPPTPPPGATYQ